MIGGVRGKQTARDRETFEQRKNSSNEDYFIPWVSIMRRELYGLSLHRSDASVIRLKSNEMRHDDEDLVVGID